MPKLQHAIFPSAVMLLMMTIGGCATSSGTPPLAVTLPSECDHNAAPVAYPPVTSAEDLGVRADKYAAALRQSNSRLRAVTACNAAVREQFAKGK